MLCSQQLGRKEVDKRLLPHAGIEPASPSYRPSMLTTTPMGPVIIPLHYYTYEMNRIWQPISTVSRISCVSTCFGLLHALGYYAQQKSDFVLPLITRFGLLLRAYRSNL